jgi:hypothetical protein
VKDYQIRIKKGLILNAFYAVESFGVNRLKLKEVIINMIAEGVTKNQES